MSVQFGKSVWACLFVLVLTPLIAKGAEGEMLDLDQAISITLKNNPGLEASRASIAAVKHQVPQAGALPDPRLTVGLANMAGGFSLDNDPMSQLQIGVSQALPFPGKLRLQEELIEHRADAASRQLDDRERELVRQVKVYWWQLFYVERALKSVQQNQSLLIQIEKNAETLYSVGRGQQQDILLAQLASAKLAKQKLVLQEERQSLQARLNGLMNRSWNQPIHSSNEIIDQPTSLPALPDQMELQNRLLEQHPLLLGLQSEVAAAQSGRELSARDRYPDFTIGAVYGMRDGREDLTSLQFSMTLPIYSARKQSRAVDQRQAELLKSRYLLEEQRLQLITELSIVVERYNQTRERLKLYDRSILPQAEQTVDILLAAYQSANANFQQLIHAQTELHNYKTEYWQAYSVAQQALAELAALTGEERLYE